MPTAKVVWSTKLDIKRVIFIYGISNFKTGLCLEIFVGGDFGGGRSGVYSLPAGCCKDVFIDNKSVRKIGIGGLNDRKIQKGQSQKKNR